MFLSKAADVFESLQLPQKDRRFRRRIMTIARSLDVKRTAPRVFGVLCAFWGTTKRQERELWTALERSTWLEPSGWRQALVLKPNLTESVL
jgi:hypothetical protein